MQKLTAGNLASFIDQLDRNTSYNYINPKNKGLIKIISVSRPEGPIKIRRWQPEKGETFANAIDESISSELLWRVANAFLPGFPVNIDRLLGASYNTRSVLEALLAHSPQFYYCYPGRIENLGGSSSIKTGHKHLLWLPDAPHAKGQITRSNSEIIVSEAPKTDAFYESLAAPSDPTPEIDIEIKRRHAQIQVALYYIGKQLNFRTWIAQNDRGIIYNNKRIGDFEGVIPRLQDERLLTAYQEAAQAALLIDCIWFKNGSLMPAVIEVEHSTGVTSGLTRMKNFKDKFIPLQNVRYVIVAADEDRDLVFREGNKSQFRDLDTRFFPYSAVEELYSLCQRRKIRGVTEDFLDCYMERVVAA
ncbi:restriction endonuclease [Mucilaginibacter endophyticus]|uniref:restriction endonuclease n=1 Tax=Mucilaginibacter endophyticus TaxID=2675003 RepID=UPI000E0DFB5D|nr:restriction endonuclease [Mucilaginibacter endophyticus]